MEAKDLIKKNRGKMGPDSITIDRIIPALGYVPGNVIVVSMKANLIKTNATLQELESVCQFYKKLMTKQKH